MPWNKSIKIFHHFREKSMAVYVEAKTLLHKGSLEILSDWLFLPQDFSVSISPFPGSSWEVQIFIRRIHIHQPSCGRLVDVYVWIYFLALYSGPLVYISVFMPVPYCFDDWSFIIYFEIRDYNALALSFFLKIDLAIWGLFWLHMEFRAVFLFL